MSEYTGDPRSYGSERYALSGKIMLSAIVILFAVVVLIICLHIYARWYLERARRRQRRTLRNRRRNSRAHIIFTTDMPSTAISHGLDPSLLKLLPTFVYSTTTHGEELLECAVCLSEFEENEKGRLLPKCNHTFHIGCIDMWFSSHSTCPLCRSPVVVNSETLQTETTPIEVVVDTSVDLPTSATSSCGEEENVKKEESSSSSSSYTCSSNSNENPLSVGSRRKGFEIVGVSIDVPRRNESFKSFDEDMNGSPGGGFKSPGGRILSFKRMLSRAGRPSTPMPLSYSSSTLEFDLEKGEAQYTSPPPPPSQPPGHFHDHQSTTTTTTSS